MALPALAAQVADELGDNVQESFAAFIREFSSDVGDGVHETRAATKDYIEQIKLMKQNERTTLYVNWSHIIEHHTTLAEAIENEYYRFEPFLRKALQGVVREHFAEYVQEENGGDREFWISFYNLPQVQRLRALTTEKIGRLLSVSGTVTRTSEVRPELMYGHFKCQDCASIQANIEQQFKYTEPRSCPNAQCNNAIRWDLDVEASTFVDFQRIRVQENTQEIPSGSMPRSMDIVLRHEAVEKAKAGDKCVFVGTLIVVPDVAQLSKPGSGATKHSRVTSRSGDGLAPDGVTGLKALGVRDMTYKLSFLACAVQPAEVATGVTNIRDDDDDQENILDKYTDEEKEELFRMKDHPRLYENMVNSIAPSVFGHSDIKRGVLLMLFGGVHKRSPQDGTKLRGDLNVCIVGDPSTAKSQFLKYVVSFLPRAVYTSGKASSAAGLTASVAKDNETGEFCIEAGALMLADNGICCIDEFDKMDIRDQVAIHEAMEQQTISISKAGIQATLNARTSILAAANPVGGRYDKTRPLKANVAMTPPIMSRFDLFFVVVDECDEVTDYNIARHIVSLHQQTDQAVDPPFTTAQLQRYIRYSRTLDPVITEESRRLLVDHYRRLRQGDVSAGSRSAYRITVRQLESLIRLSEALARLHCDDKVRPAYVKEAVRLLRQSIIHVEMDDITLDIEPEKEKKKKRPTGEAGAGGEGGSDDGGSDDGGDGGDGDGGDAGGRRRSKRGTGAAAAEDGSGGEAGGDGDDSGSAAAEPEAERKVTHLSFEKYERISNLLVHRLRHTSVEATGMRQIDLVNWYLEEEKDNLSSFEEVAEAKRIIELVINRLVVHDNVLLVLEEDDEGGDDSDNDDPTAVAARLNQRVLVVHPNYDPVLK